MKTLKTIKVIGPGLLLFFSIFFSCNKNTETVSEEVTLKTWLEDKDNYQKLINYYEKNNCDEVKRLSKNFKTNQYKNYSYLRLAECYVGDKEKSMFYLTEAIKSGYHIKLIDSIMFENVWGEIKSIYPDLNQEYWSQQDTSYFSTVEQLVYLDQKVRYDRAPDSNDFSAESKQDSISTDWFIEFCRSNGFPKVYENSHFEFRVINPTILAVHAESIYKREILDCAIEAAQLEKISWMIPISIFKSFYVGGKPSGAVNPLFMLYFDEQEDLDYEKSLLQLHAIQELYGMDMPSKITLRPSLSNNLQKAVVEKQLAQVKKILVDEFSLREDEIVIDLTPSKENVYDDFTDSYLYTITASRF